MRCAPASRRSLAAALAVAALGPGLAAGSPGAAPEAKRRALPCDVRRDGRRLGTSSVASLAVVGMTCAQGKRLVRAYHACRRARGGVKGRCPGVRGFRCAERRRGTPRQFSATATCRSGARSVRFTYTQFT
jgi:hypothetical protein